LQTNTRLERLDDYPFQRLNELLAPITPRANRQPIAMSVGEPQHDPPPILAETVAKHAAAWNKYPPMAGTPAFREAVAAWLTRRYRLPQGMIGSEKHILPVCGTKEGLFLAGLLAVPDQKNSRRPAALVPNPYYLVYTGSAALSGAEPIYLDATAETGFLPDLDAIPEETLARTALFFLCSPANPQGTAASLGYLKRCIELARQFDFVLVVDECYAEIWDKAPPAGALEACAALGGRLDNVIVFHSLSKRSSAAGLRSGFIAGDPKLIDKYLRLRNYGGTQVPIPLQEAATALWRDEAHVEENRAKYRSKIDTAERVLGKRYGFYRPPGGFFLWLDVGDGVKASAALWREAAIRTLPGGYIAHPQNGRNAGAPYIRVALVHDDETIAAGLERMVQVLG
jgi:succinyldiaminopimelate transaminase